MEFRCYYVYHHLHGNWSLINSPTKWIESLCKSFFWLPSFINPLSSFSLSSYIIRLSALEIILSVECKIRWDVMRLIQKDTLHNLISHVLRSTKYCIVSHYLYWLVRYKIKSTEIHHICTLCIVNNWWIIVRLIN